MKKLIAIITIILIAGAVSTSLAADLTAGPITLKIYGYARLDASYDTHKTAAGDLMFYVLPEAAGEKDSEFNMTAKETRLGLAITGPDVGNLKTSGRIEIDFYGGGSVMSSTPRMRLAFLDIGTDFGLTVRAGQDWDTFITVIPRIVNFSYLADAGALGLRRPQLRFTQDIPMGPVKLTAKVAASRTVATGGAETDLDGGRQDDGVDSGLPTLQYNIAIETRLLTDKPTRISVSGHAGRETMDTVVSNVIVKVDSDDYDSWSVIGSLYVPVIDMLAVQGCVWQGENLDAYFGAIGQGINLQKKTAIAAKGGFVQLLIDPVDSVKIALNYSIDDPDDADLSKGNRSKNELIMANVSYALTPDVTLAAEYSRMKTSYLDGDDATNDRVQGAAIYKF